MEAAVKILKPKNVQLEISFDNREMFSIWQDPHGRLLSENRKTYIEIRQKRVKGNSLRRKICFEDGFTDKWDNRRYSVLKDGRSVDVYPTDWNCKQTGFRIVLAYLVELLNPKVRISVDLQSYPTIQRVMRIMTGLIDRIDYVQYDTMTINEKEWRSLIRKTPVKDVVAFNVRQEVKSLVETYQHILLSRASKLRIEELSNIHSVAIELRRVAFSDAEIQSFLSSLEKGNNPKLEYISFQIKGKVNLDAIVEGFEFVGRNRMIKFKNCKMNVKCRSGINIKLSNGYTCTLEVDKVLRKTVYSHRKRSPFYDDLLKIFICR